MALKLFSGAWGKIIYEKKLEARNALICIDLKTIEKVAKHFFCYLEKKKRSQTDKTVTKI
jgi:hypothetical protein